MLKICHIAYQTWPTQVGSVSRLEQLLAAQFKKGIDLFVISGPFQAANSTSNIEIRNGITYYRTSKTEETGFSNAKGLVTRFLKFVRMFSFIKQVYRICMVEKPDILHAHATFLMGLSAWFISCKLGIPYVYEVRSTWEEDVTGGCLIEIQRGIIRFFERLAIRLSNGTVFISRGLIEHYGSSPKSKSCIIYNCVEKRNSNAVEHHTSKKLRIGYIGTLIDYEGLPFLLEAGYHLKTEGIPFSIDIIGSGIAETSLKENCKNLNLNDVVTFHGRVNSEDVDAFYNQIDLIVLPRRNLLITNKVSGLKPIEAFSHKKIVLAADVGGMQELFSDMVHGIFFKAENVDDLIVKILWVYHNNKDALKLAENGYALFKSKFTLDSMGKQYIDLYKQITLKTEIGS